MHASALENQVVFFIIVIKFQEFVLINLASEIVESSSLTDS